MIRTNIWIYRLRALFGSGIPQTHLLQSRSLERQVRVDIYLPTGLQALRQRLHCLVFNDGQDLPRMETVSQLKQIRNGKTYPPFALVGIHADANRLREYGTAGQADYAGRGDRAGQYEKFIREELIPWLQRNYGLAYSAKYSTIAGFSLGGLSALDLLWRNPDLFSQVGVFSGSLWWRSTAFDPKSPDADRIAHHRIATGNHQPGLRFWLQTGTEDEKSDRNRNGVIDAIDDTLDLIKELQRHGYKQPEDIRYLEVVGGRHEPTTWGKALPDFLDWALTNRQN